MTNARIDFAALGRRARIEPVVLIAGRIGPPKG